MTRLGTAVEHNRNTYEHLAGMVRDSSHIRANSMGSFESRGTLVKSGKTGGEELNNWAGRDAVKPVH